MVAVAVTTLIPTHDAPTRCSEQRSKDVVCPREIEATVHHEQWCSSWITPFVNGDVELPRRDEVVAVGCLSAGVRPERRVGYRCKLHAVESTRSMAAMRYYARITLLVSALSASAVVAACGTDTRSANDTLPPIATTTTTSTVPPTTTTIPQTYVIKKGDSLFSIAEMFGISQAELAALNNIVDIDKIQAGQKLKLPQVGATTTTPPTTAAPTTTG